jgi:hypothetical protein
VGFLALAIAGLTSQDDQTVRAAYLSMELIGWAVIVPLSLAALLSGLVQSLDTQWGLFRHYWVLTKFLLTVAATELLLLHMRVASRVSDIVAGASRGTGFGTLQVQLVTDAGLAVVALLTATTLSVYKPWGRTAYGRRKQQEQLRLAANLFSQLDSGDEAQTHPESPATNSWVWALGFVGAILLLVFLHVTGIVGGGH